MKTPHAIILVLIILAMMTAVAEFLRPRKVDDGKTHIVWVASSDPNKQLVEEMFNKSSSKTHVTLDTNNRGVTKTLVQCTAGIGGDVLDVINEYNIQVYHNAGILMPLDGKAEKYGFSLDTLAEQVRGLCVVDCVDKKGNITKHQYTYPATVDNDFIIYNKSLFDKYKVPYPSEDLTWEEYLDIAKKLTVYKKDGDPVPEVFGAMGAADRFLVILWEKGGDMFKDNGTASGLDTPEAFEALKFYRNLFFKYKVEPTQALKTGVQATGTGTESSASSHAYLGNSKVAMIWAGRWYLKELRVYDNYNKQRKALWEKNNPGKPCPYEELRYGACQLPRFKNSKRYNMTFTGRTVGINVNTRYPVSSMEFLAFLASPEYNKFICKIGGAKPPNKEYWKPEFFYNPDYPGEKPVHDMSIKAVKSGRCMQRSLFIETSAAARILGNILNVISVKEGVSDAELRKMAKDAAAKTNAIIARNIERNKPLKIAYDAKRKNRNKKGTAPARKSNRNGF